MAGLSVCMLLAPVSLPHTNICKLWGLLQGHVGLRFALGIFSLNPMPAAPAVSISIVRLLLALAAAFEEITALASTDALTGIANSRQCFEIVTGLLATAGGDEQTSPSAVDPHRFKEISDAHGHGAGNLGLVRVAHRLQHAAGTYGVAVGQAGDDEVARACRFRRRS